MCSLCLKKIFDFIYSRLHIQTGPSALTGIHLKASVECSEMLAPDSDPHQVLWICLFWWWAVRLEATNGLVAHGADAADL